MKSLSDLPAWSISAALVFVNLLLLFRILRTDQRHFKLSRLFQLLMFDTVAFYALVSFSEVASDRIRAEIWPWIIVAIFALLVLPFALYWVWLALVSVFLLPIELEHWREWIPAARAFISFARGINYPYFGYDEETNDLKERLGGSILIRGGGPGIIMLRPEHAVALHSGLKLTRVAGGDIVFTRRWERVLQLVDLRTHLPIMLNVEAVTKDGIGIKFHMFVPCRIDPAGAPPQPERPYPFNPDTVFKIVCQQNVEEKGKTVWYEFVQQKAKKAARDVMATYMLDRLLTAEDPHKIPRDEVRTRIRDRLIAEMAGAGIEIIGVGISNIEPNEPAAETKTTPAAGEAEAARISVADQRVASWQAEWQRRAAEREARGEAQAIRILEQARAQVFTELIHAVEEGFREMAASGAAKPNDIIAFSFVNAVEQMLSNQALPESLGVADTRSTLQTVRRLMLLDR